MVVHRDLKPENRKNWYINWNKKIDKSREFYEFMVADSFFQCLILTWEGDLGATCWHSKDIGNLHLEAKRRHIRDCRTKYTKKEQSKTDISTEIKKDMSPKIKLIHQMKIKNLIYQMK